MTDWGMAIRIFIVGFSAVFITLAILMGSIKLSGVVLNSLDKKKSKK